jgi:putative peptidoglycan lipid II flippase
MTDEPRQAGDSVDITTQSLVRPAAMMAVGTALSRLTGVGRVAALVFALGVTESRLADSYNIANTLPNVLYELALGGIMTSVFIPILVQELRTKERKEAWESVSVLITTGVAMLLFLTLVAIAIAPWVIEIFSSRVSGPEGARQQELATFFLRWFAPQIALYGLAAMGAALLNAHGRFALPMFAPILNNVVVIGTFIAFGLVVSGTPTNETVEASTSLKLLLSLGTTGGVAAMVLVYWPALRDLPGRVRMRFDLAHPAVRRLVRLSGWILLYVATNTVGLGVSFYLANGAQGGATAYITAFAFFQLPIGIAAISILTALVPKLSAHYVDGEAESFRARLAGGMRAMVLVMLPATVAFLLLGHPLIEVLLEHGIVGGSSSELVSSVLAMFAIGLLPFAVFQLYMRAFYTRQDTRTPALVNVAENGLTIALDFALFPSMGVEGLALAHSLGYVAGCAIAGWILARQAGGLELRATLGESGRIAAASLLAALAIAAVMLGLAEAISAGIGRALAQLVLAGGLGVLVFLGASQLLGVKELGTLRRLLPSR